MVLLNLIQLGFANNLFLGKKKKKREKKSYSNTSNLPQVCCIEKETTLFKSLHEYCFCLADLKNPSWTTYLTFYDVIISSGMQHPVTSENILQ